MAKSPLLCFSPKGEEAPEFLSRTVRGSSLPAASACGCGHAEMQARRSELAGREIEGAFCENQSRGFGINQRRACHQPFSQVKVPGLRPYSREPG